jgi:membrane-associated protein
MFDIVSLIKAAGYLGIFGIIFSESGILLGLFLPGDSLLFTAGFLASQGYLNIIALVGIAWVAAVSGDSLGYYFGKKLGPKVFTREKSIFLKKDYIPRAERFYATYGPKTIILARFIPVIRTIAPIMAGVGSMHYSTFFFYNIIGGACWAVGLPLLGFFLGSTIPNVDRYLIPIVLVIIIVSALPTISHLWHEYRT